MTLPSFRAILTFLPPCRIFFTHLGVSPDGNPWGGWRRSGCIRDGAYMRDYVREVNACGGVVSIDIQIRDDSTFDEEQLRCLFEINK